MHRNNSSNGTGKPFCAPFTGRLIVRKYNAQEEWMPEEANAAV